MEESSTTYFDIVRHVLQDAEHDFPLSGGQLVTFNRLRVGHLCDLLLCVSVVDGLNNVAMRAQKEEKSMWEFGGYKSEGECTERDLGKDHRTWRANFTRS